MGSKLKSKTLRDKAKARRRAQSIKIQNFKPVVRQVDIEKVKEEFKEGK